MFKIKQYLQEKAKGEKLTWTVLACGASLDSLFGGPVLLDFANHKATLFDEVTTGSVLLGSQISGGPLLEF
jgi:hypothetical protein